MATNLYGFFSENGNLMYRCSTGRSIQFPRTTDDLVSLYPKLMPEEFGEIMKEVELCWRREGENGHYGSISVQYAMRQSKR